MFRWPSSRDGEHRAAAALSAWDTAVRPFLMLLTFFAFDLWLRTARELPASSYAQPIAVWIYVQQLGSMWLFPLALAALMMVRGRLSLGWADLQDGRYTRHFIVLLAGLMAWNFATYDFNLYFDRWHIYDRLLLVALVPLIAYRPLFVFPFLFVLMPLIYQFQHPSCLTFLWPEKLLAVRILILFGACCVLASVSTKPSRWPFMYVLLCLVAVHYWPSGLAKLRMDWVIDNRLANILFSAYANGWLSWWDATEILEFSRWIGRIDGPLRLFTVGVELAAIVLLCRFQFAIVLIGLWTALHIGILAIGGIFFLNWIVVDVALLCFLARTDQEQRQSIFNAPRFLLFILIVFCHKFWIDAPQFAWFDTRLCYSFELEALTDDDRSFVIPARHMAPYDYAFTWNRFGFLYPKKQLEVRYGATYDRNTMLQLQQAQTAEDVWQIERELGTVRFDSGLSRDYEEFLRVFLANLNRRGKLRWLDWIQRPPGLISFDSDEALSSGQKIRRVNVHRVTTLGTTTTFAELRRETVLTVDLMTSTHEEIR